jgi:nucleoside-diphosphate-sugar epimerase
MEVAYDFLDKEPPFEADALNYLKGNYWMDNTKLMETGFELKYPSFRDGMPETIQWYEENDMI